MRLEQMVIGSVDDGHSHRRTAQCIGREQACEAASNDHDSMRRLNRHRSLSPFGRELRQLVSHPSGTEGRRLGTTVALLVSKAFRGAAMMQSRTEVALF